MKNLTLLLLIAISLLSCSKADKKISLNVASFNLRMDTPKDGENAWKFRKEMVKSLVQYHDFDIMGTQEGFEHQLNDILELENLDYVGVGREDGKLEGEHSAIFYKKDKFIVLQKSNFWLSETPDIPSKGWDTTCCNRLCSWAKFQEKTSEKTFFVFNVHYDHIGKVARKNSSILLLQRIDSIADEQTVFLTGDFNAIPEQEPIKIIYESNKLQDSFLITEQKPYGNFGTFNDFDVYRPLRERIDYVWVSKDISVKRYATLSDSYAGYFASDHFPVVVTAEF